MTTKDIVFHHIKSRNGKVNLQELTAAVLRNDPDSRWDQSHWSFYRSQITSEKGRYTRLFSDEVKRNLRLFDHGKVERGPSVAFRSERNRAMPLGSGKDDWPEWDTPSDEEQVILARALMPYIKILAPEIVARIAEDNNKNLSAWREQFESLGIRPAIYLWEGSPVAFPSIRRHVGSGETSTFRSGPNYQKEKMPCTWMTILIRSNYGRLPYGTSGLE